MILKIDIAVGADVRCRFGPDHEEFRDTARVVFQVMAIAAVPGPADAVAGTDDLFAVIFVVILFFPILNTNLKAFNVMFD